MSLMMPPIVREFSDGLRVEPPWESIVDFACHRSFCGRRMYPRQLTLLKLIHLETDNFTQFDWDVVGAWSESFKNRTHPIGVQPDIFERIEYLQHHGYHHFTQVQFVGGRRGSKGVVCGILGAERLAFLHSIGDWQSYFGFIPGTVAELTVMATSQAQAAKRQFRDVRLAVQGCEYLKRDLMNPRYTDFYIQTPSDRQYIDACRAQGVSVDPEFSSLYAVASSAVSTSQRGGAGIVNLYDEFAHMLMGTGSTQSGEEIYESQQPSLDQFGIHALTCAVSSPFCLEPSTRVLTEDLQWVPVGSLQLGDKLIGFDEDSRRGEERAWRQAEVVETSIIHAPRQKITMASGKEITCTDEHLWLTKRRVEGVGKGRGRGLRSQSYPQTWCWVKTKDLRTGDSIKTIGTDPWETDESREAGYLAGFFDGEGHVTSGTNLSVGYSQNFGPVQASVERMLKERDYEVRTHIDREGRMARSRLGGGLPEVFRFLGTLRPERLLAGFPSKLYGRRIYSRLGRDMDLVTAVERVDDGPVVALGTSTHTLVAEGLLSHNTMVGKFYELYEEGTVLLDSYLAREGMKKTDALIDIMDDRDDTSEADPAMLVCQFPSWELYRDWERSTSIPLRKGKRNGPAFRNPVQWPPEGDRPENIMQRKRKIKNPEKFAVEREAQFATVQDAYLDPLKVEAMFERPWWYTEDLHQQDHGRMAIVYRGHGDPSKSNANFGFAICHLENAPCDACGHVPDVTYTIGSASPHLSKPWEHRCTKTVPDGAGDVRPGRIWPYVIVDRLHVWKPENYVGHTLDYELLREEIVELVSHFPSMKKLTYDQANSIGFISHQKRVFPNTRVFEVTFTPKENWNRFEKFKTAMNMGLIKSYRDTLFEDGRSLLELELKFLQEKNGKVDKMSFGPVTTKDLSDAVMVCAVDLLSDHLDRWYSGANLPVFGSTNVAGMRSGRETDRAQASGIYSPTASPGPHNHPSGSRGEINRQRINERRDAAAARRSYGDPMRNRGGRSTPSGPTRSRW